MKDWRELFEDDALVDGWELYLDGKVENLEVYEERIPRMIPTTTSPRRQRSSRYIPR